jgi:hypothetical protein
VDRTGSLRETAANRAKLARLRSALEEALAQGLRRGFHGELRLALVIQDGTIQDLRTAVERRQR